jgi:hypothetical protein
MSRHLWRTCVHLPGWILILLVRGYQLLVSPWLGPQCRFQPTCSAYFIASVKKHGSLRGTARGLRRITRCHPFHPGGWDPP